MSLDAVHRWEGMPVPLDHPIVSPILVGRTAYLTALDAALEYAQAGSGQVALISGEAGIGKTALLAEVRVRAQQHGFRLLKSACYEPDRSLAYGPLLDLLQRHLVGRLDDALIETLGSASAEIAKLLPELSSRQPHIMSGPPLEPAQAKRRLFEALSRVIVQLADRRPTLIAIEDLHWCDDTSLEFLLLLARLIREEPILLLLTYRSDEIHPALRHFLASLDRARLAQEWPLSPLSRQEVDTMVRAMFASSPPMRADFLDALYSLTEGNPFFIEECMKTLLQSGDISFVGGRWKRNTANEFHIPRSVQDAVHQRTERLSTWAKEALRLAAVVGQRFSITLLQELTGQDEDTLLGSLKELIAAQLVSETSENDEAMFRHALTREVVYTELLMRERKALHRSIARTLERLFAAHLDAHLPQLAYHSFQAELWPEALVYSRQVAEHSLALLAPSPAIEHFMRALEACRRLGQSPDAALYLGRGKAYETLGEFVSAEDDYTQALAAGQTAGDGGAQWRGQIALGFLWAGRDYRRAGEHFRRALDLADALGAADLRAHSLNRLGNWLANTDDVLAGLALHQEALALFEQLGDELGVAQTLDLLATASGIAGDPLASAEYSAQAIPRLRRIGDIGTLISCLTIRSALGNPQFEQATPSALFTAEECYRDLDEAARHAQQIRSPAALAFAELTRCAATFSYGRLGEALAHGQEALRLAEEAEHQQWMAGTYHALSYGYCMLQEPRQAVEYAKQALALAHQTGSAWWIGNARASLAHALVLNGENVAAEEILGPLTLEWQPHILTERRMFWAWGCALLAQSKPTDALVVAERLLATTPSRAEGEQPIPWLLKLKGEALLALERLEEATTALESALGGAKLRHEAPLEWQVNVSLGQAYRQSGRADDAESQYGAARQLIATLASSLNDGERRERFTQAASARLPMESLPAHGAARVAPGGLTPRECEVAVLVAQGLSNRATAENLVVSERTVESHVTRILGKLSFSSRAQIAVWAISQGLATADDAHS